MDKQTEELRPSRMANGDTYELWEFAQYRLVFYFKFKIHFLKYTYHIKVLSHENMPHIK